MWRQNVFAAENGGEVQKMEGLYDRLDKEREKWNEQLNNPLTWGWGGEPDELNDWARRSTNDAVREPDRWGERQQGHSDKTPDGVSRNPEPIPTSLERLLYSFAHKLKADGCQRSYAFVQVSSGEYLINLLDPSDLPFPSSCPLKPRSRKLEKLHINFWGQKSPNNTLRFVHIWIPYFNMHLILQLYF